MKTSIASVAAFFASLCLATASDGPNFGGCNCDDPTWADHGAYVECIVLALKSDTTLDKQDRKDIKKAAAKSDCGKVPSLDEDGGDDYRLGLWGNVVLGADLTADLVAAASSVAPLVAADGRLRIPVKIHGTTKKPESTVDERFLEALAAAARGKDVGPFVPMEPDAEIVTELPSLEDHFYR